MILKEAIEIEDKENAKYRYKDEIDQMLEIDRLLEECENSPSFKEWEQESLDIIKNMSFINEV